jgi:multiple sugar transport system ATP-binding protein
MDEPLSNLDALLRLQFRAELKRIVQKINTTTLYVTHDQAEAMSLGDKVAVMRDGRIAQIGAPLDVYDKPSDRFVGGFLGAPPMNFFPATVTEAGHLSLDGLEIPAGRTLQSGQKVLVGIRAEKLEVSAQRSEGLHPAAVEVVEPTGASVLLTVTFGGHEIKVQAPPTFTTRPGETVWLRAAPESLRFYDPETSLALLGPP